MFSSRRKKNNSEMGMNRKHRKATHTQGEVCAYGRWRSMEVSCDRNGQIMEAMEKEKQDNNRTNQTKTKKKHYLTQTMTK